MRANFIGAEQILPPIDMCTRAGCKDAHLAEPRKVESRLYTLRRGVLPVYSVSKYCRSKFTITIGCSNGNTDGPSISTDCLTRYYHNYSVQHAGHPHSKREYYGGVPDPIHVAEHSFVERALCIYFETQMAFSQWVFLF